MAWPEIEYQFESEFPEPDLEAFSSLDEMFTSQEFKDALADAYRKPRGTSEFDSLSARRVGVVGKDKLKYALVSGFRENARQVEREQMVKGPTPYGTGIFLVKEFAFVGPDWYEYRKTGAPGWPGENELYHGTKDAPNEDARLMFRQLANDFLGQHS